MALASHDPHSRLLAYQALNDFYMHSEASRWKERMEITFILDLLNASRAKDGQKLSFVVALFFARAVKLMLYPGIGNFAIWFFFFFFYETDMNNCRVSCRALGNSLLLAATVISKQSQPVVHG